MKNFYSVNDISDLKKALDLATIFKHNSLKYRDIGKGKLLVLLFFNPSLRTKLSTQKAAMNLGMQVISMDMKDSWAWEFEKGAVMNSDKAEHIAEAARVISSYADIIGLRTFPSLQNKISDYKDLVIKSFMKYSTKPVISLESAIRHPLQSFADLLTIREKSKVMNPKIVLSWAPHPKVLPQAVSNSFLEWMKAAGLSVCITHPKGFDLDPGFTDGHTINYNQEEALTNADFVYVKNWSALAPYGKTASNQQSWMMTSKKLSLTNNAKLMHCLPVRRNIVIGDDAMDSENSVIHELAENRLYTAQAILYKMLTSH